MKEDGRGSEWGWRAAYLLTAGGIYLADQMTKAWAVGTLKHGRIKTVVERFLYLSYAENPGIAFGQLQEVGAFSRWFFAALAALAAVGVIVYFLRTPRTDDTALGACALLLAGIVGNLTDRVRLGYVVDFIEVHLGSYQWPTFNVADAAICTGAALLMLGLLMEGKRQKVKGKSEEAGTAVH